MEFVGVDKSARYGKGGHCRSGQCGTMWQGWTMREWTMQEWSNACEKCSYPSPETKRSLMNYARINCINHFDSGAYTPMQFLDAMSHSMGVHTAALNDHLRGDSDDDDDGADEDEAQTTDQTPPQDAAITFEIPVTRASDDCCEVCLINRQDPRIALVPCGHQRFCESCVETMHQRGDRRPRCSADITMILYLY